ncbi:MAG: hypothetical protein PF437_02715, partial [Sulfurimonas sp.]|nr:hypothetical protein [Sulfurimonas sp.]
MYKSELDKHIQNSSISNSFVFFGESSFLIDSYTKQLSNIEDASALTFYYDEYDFKSARAHLSQASLFGGRNVLVLKSEKKVPKKELDDLVDLCEKNQENFFIYAYYGSDHKTYSKAFNKKNTMCVRFFNPTHHEAINIIAEVVKEKDVNMDKYSIAHLLNIHNGDVSLAYNEIEKFRVYDKVITTKDIE